jgi:hypothetical protein
MIRDVALVDLCLAALRGDLSRSRLPLAFVQVHQVDARSAFREAVRNCAADPAASASDDGTLAVEPEHIFSGYTISQDGFPLSTIFFHVPAPSA